MGIAYKRRSFLIQGVSEEIQFLARNIERFLDEFPVADSMLSARTINLDGRWSSWLRKLTMYTLATAGGK